MGHRHHVVLGVEQALHGPGQLGLVVDDDHLAPARGRLGRHRLLGGSGPLFRRQGQGHPEQAALARLALHLDNAPVFQHHALADGQPQPGAHPGRLGGEERLEQARLGLGSDALAGVGHLDHHPLVGPAHAHPDLVGLGVPLLDGLGGVDQQVQHQLAQAELAALDEG